VYVRAPGAVARCVSCGQVVIVLVELGAELRVDATRFELAPGER
jgi:hypothetical protein